MLLAQLPVESVRKIVRRINARVPASERVQDELAFERQIDEIRQKGFAYNDQFTDGAAAIAVRLPMPAGTSIAVLGLGGPTERIQKKLPELVELMHELIEQHIDLDLAD